MITITCTTTVKFPIALSTKNQIDLVILPIGILQLRDGNDIGSLLSSAKSQQISITEATVTKNDRLVNLKVNLKVNTFEHDDTHITLIGDGSMFMHEEDDYYDDFMNTEIIKLSLDESVVTFFKPKIRLA
jgi:hypothetical protein